MIYYVNNKIYDWNFEDDNIVKVYRDGVVCYYKMVAGSTAQTPCYAVVDDITQYSDTEFIDVFDKATSKWYKLNNLNDYEEYGVYGEGRNITYYEGKLTLDNGYEYQYSGSEWVNLGEATGTSITIMSPEYLEKTANAKGLVDLSEYMSPDTRIQMKLCPTSGAGGFFLADSMVSDTQDWRVFFLSSNLYYDFIANRENKNGSWLNNIFEWEVGQYYIKDITASTNNVINGTYTDTYERDHTMKLFGAYYQNKLDYSMNDLGRVYYLKIFKNNVLVRDYIPILSGGSYSLYDKVTKTSATVYGTLTGSSNVQEVEVGDSVYPLYYPVKQDPPQNLVFTDMAEAEAYACPYEGLMATIGGDLYVFSKVGNDYEWVALAYTLSGTTKSSTNFTLKINGSDVTATVYEDNGDNTYNWGVVYTDPITSVTSMASGNTNLLTFDWGTADTRQLTSIGNEAFRGCSAMTSMPSIPSGVTSFGDHSFRGCYNMNSNGSIVIPEGIVSIGSNSFDGVFNYSSSPRSIYLPSTLTSVGSGAFANRQYLSSTYVTSLSSYMKINFGDSNSVPFYTNNNFNFYVNGVRTTSIVVPSDVTELKNYTFYRLRTLTSVTIPNTVTKWDGAGTFSQSGLRTATIATDSSLAKIGGFAFNSTYLTGFTVPSSIERIEGYAFSDVGTLTSFTIPSNVTYIGDYAFNGCSGITSITIPSSVTSMGRYAFRNCTGMTSVTMESSTPPSIYAGVFDGFGCPIYVPCNAVSAYRSANIWSSYSNRIVGYESCTTYQWVSVAGEYYCDNGDKYSLEKYQRSFDGGTTWEDTGDYRLGTLIETGSADCNAMSLDEYIAASTTGTSGSNIVISPVISGVKRLVVDLTEQGTVGSFCFLNVKDSVNANLMLSISSYKNSNTTLMYGGSWSGGRPSSIIEAVSRQDITWCYYDKVDKNKIIFDFEAYDSTKTFVIETWQINFNTPFVVEIWV